MPKTLRSPVFAYVRAHPFSTMALANIIGDSCYLGYAFAAHGFVSLTKLAGALFTMAAHALLLAYGDDQAARVAAEQGPLSSLVMRLRGFAQGWVRVLPPLAQRVARARPVGITFLMLSVNGLALIADAFHNLRIHYSHAMDAQALMGFLIALGTGAFAAADFVRTQDRANLMTFIAPSVLLCASAVNIVLAFLTVNPFIWIAVVAFLLSNFAGFYTRIDKNRHIMGQHTPPPSGLTEGVRPPETPSNPAS